MPTTTSITVVDPTGAASALFNVDQSVQFFGTSIDCLNGDLKFKSVSATANATSGLTLNGLGTGSKIVLATNTVAVTGNVTVPGFLFCAGSVSSTGTKITYTPIII